MNYLLEVKDLIGIDGEMKLNNNDTPKRIRGHEKLRVTWEPGSKGNGDKRFYVENIVVTIRDMLRLTQLIADNERRNARMRASLMYLRPS